MSSRPVGSSPADVVLLVILIGQCVHVGLGRHGLVEGGVEDEDLGQFGQELAHGFVAFQVGGAVQGRQVHVLFPLLDDFGGDDEALGEDAAVHDAVAGGSDLVERLDGAVFGVEQGVEHQLDAHGVVGDVGFDDFRAAVGHLGFEEGAFQADFLDSAGGQDFLVVHFVELVLDGRTSAVDY